MRLVETKLLILETPDTKTLQFTTTNQENSDIYKDTKTIIYKTRDMLASGRCICFGIKNRQPILFEIHKIVSAQRQQTRHDDINIFFDCDRVVSEISKLFFSYKETVYKKIIVEHTAMQKQIKELKAAQKTKIQLINESINGRIQNLLQQKQSLQSNLKELRAEKRVIIKQAREEHKEEVRQKITVEQHEQQFTNLRAPQIKQQLKKYRKQQNRVVVSEPAQQEQQIPQPELIQLPQIESVYEEIIKEVEDQQCQETDSESDSEEDSDSQNDSDDDENNSNIQDTENDSQNDETDDKTDNNIQDIDNQQDNIDQEPIITEEIIDQEPIITEENLSHPYKLSDTETSYNYSIEEINNNDLLNIIAHNNVLFTPLINLAYQSLNKLQDNTKISYYDSVKMFQFIVDYFIDALNNKNYQVSKLISLSSAELSILGSNQILDVRTNYFLQFNGKFNETIQYKSDNVTATKIDINKHLFYKKLSLKSLCLLQIDTEGLDKPNIQQFQKCLIDMCQPSNKDKIVVKIQSLYDYQVNLLSIDEIYKLSQDYQFYKDYTIHQVICSQIHQHCIYFMDIDHVDRVFSNDHQLQNFISDIRSAILLVRNEMNHMSQSVHNLKWKSNKHISHDEIYIYTSNNCSKSFHVYCPNIVIRCEQYNSITNRVKQLLKLDSKYSDEQLDTIIDCTKSPNQKLKCLRIPLFGKICQKDGKNYMDLDRKCSKPYDEQENFNIKVFDKIFIHDIQFDFIINDNIYDLDRAIFQIDYTKQKQDEIQNDSDSDIEIDGEDRKQFIQSIDIECTDQGEYNGKKFLEIFYKGDCPICKRYHDQQTNRRVFIYRTFAKCFQAQDIIKFKYTKKSQKQQVIISDEEQYKLKNQQIIHKFENISLKQDFNFQTMQNCIHQYQNHVEYNALIAKYSYVISPCGTGKTFQIAKNIDRLIEYRQKQNLQPPRILMISTRISFSQCIVQQLNDEYKCLAKFDIYSDDKFYQNGEDLQQKFNLNQSQYLMCQVECLIKLNGNHDNKYDMVIIDECNSVFKQISSGLRQEGVIIDKIRSLMHHAQHVIIADAFLNYPMFLYFHYLSHESKNYQIIVNTYKPYVQMVNMLTQKTQLVRDNEQDEKNLICLKMKWKESESNVYDYYQQIKQTVKHVPTIKGIINSHYIDSQSKQLISYDQCLQNIQQNCSKDTVELIMNHPQQSKQIYDLLVQAKQAHINIMKRVVPMKETVIESVQLENKFMYNFIIDFKNAFHLFMNNLVQLLESGENVVVLLSQREIGIGIINTLLKLKLIQNQEEEVLFLHGDNLREVKDNEGNIVKMRDYKNDFYKREDKENISDKCKLFMYTKTLTQGVSLQSNFKHQIAYLDKDFSTYLSIQELAQMSFRMRKIEQTTIYSHNIRGCGQPFRNENIQKEISSHFNYSQYDYTMTTKQISDNQMYHVLKDCQQSQNNNLGLYLLAALIRSSCGHNITCQILDPEDEIDKFKIEKQSKQQIQYNIQYQDLGELQFIEKYGSNRAYQSDHKVQFLDLKHKRYGMILDILSEIKKKPIQLIRDCIGNCSQNDEIIHIDEQITQLNESPIVTQFDYFYKLFIDSQCDRRQAMTCEQFDNQVYTNGDDYQYLKQIFTTPVLNIIMQILCCNKTNTYDSSYMKKIHQAETICVLLLNQTFKIQQIELGEYYTVTFALNNILSKNKLAQHLQQYHILTDADKEKLMKTIGLQKTSEKKLLEKFRVQIKSLRQKKADNTNGLMIHLVKKLQNPFNLENVKTKQERKQEKIVKEQIQQQN